MRKTKLALKAFIVCGGLVACAESQLATPQEEEQLQAGVLPEDSSASVDPQDLIQDDADLNLVASFDIPGQAAVRFYEPSSGSILMVELGNMAHGVLTGKEIREQGAVAIYEQLSGEPAPAALVQAADRAAKALAEAGTSDLQTKLDERDVSVGELLSTPVQSDLASASSTVSDGLARTSQALTYWEWRGDKCHEPYGSHEKSKIYFNVWQTLNWTTYDRDQASSSTWCQGGTIRAGVRARPWYTWSSWARNTLPTNWYVSYYHTDGPDFDFQVVVDQASDAGDLYSTCNYAWTN